MTPDLRKHADDCFNSFQYEMLGKPIFPDDTPDEAIRIAYNQGFIDACKYMTDYISKRLDKIEANI